MHNHYLLSGILKKTLKKLCFLLYIMLTLKNKEKAQCNSGKLSFIWGKMRTAAREISPQIVLRNCSEKVGGRSVYT